MGTHFGGMPLAGILDFLIENVIEGAAMLECVKVNGNIQNSQTDRGRVRKYHREISL